LKLDIESERYAATGNISGSGVERALGTPSLNPLQILLRETVQNSWDARLSDDAPVRFRIELRSLTKQQRSSMVAALAKLPSDSVTRPRIEASLAAQEMRVLCIEDFGTAGLCGPTRADVSVDANEQRDFVNFFRNIGSPRDRHFGAGTYGYGKCSTYSMSGCRTILAYTATTHSGSLVHRAIAASIGDPFEHGGKRYTGRHWWGVRSDDGIVDPVEGKEAIRLASDLGFSERSGREKGTSLLIVDPVLEDRSSDDIAEEIAQSLLWYCWPKMLVVVGSCPAMQFEILIDGRSIAIPEPRRFAPLTIFSDCMKALKSGGGNAIRCERPSRNLGNLALVKGPRQPRKQIVSGSSFSMMPAASFHVALMRPAELVVKYLEGPQLPSDLVEYAGVFICDDGVESAFANAEPPAHDDWVPDHLEGADRTFVRVALKRVKEALQEFSSIAVSPSTTASTRSLALLSDSLGGVLIGQHGQRLSSRTREANSGGRRRQSGLVQISQAEPFRFAMVRRKPCALFRFGISGPVSRKVRVRGNPQVVMEGGVLDVPAGFDQPEVVAWLNSKGKEISSGAILSATIEENVDFLVAVSIPGDCAVRVQLDLVKDTR
jgi:hypothetical protein